MVLDDATSEIYYAQLVEAESTRSVMAALREVVETRGLFCSLYSDRAGHFFVTPKRGERVDHEPSHAGGTRLAGTRSEDDRRRIHRRHEDASERNFGTWQGRLPQELRVRGITDMVQANEFLRNEYIAEFNSRFTVSAAQKGSAFVRARRKDLDWIFSVQHERTVNNDNTVWSGKSRLPAGQNTLAEYPGRTNGHGARASGRPHVDPLWTARDRAICRRSNCRRKRPRRRGTPRLPTGRAA